MTIPRTLAAVGAIGALAIGALAALGRSSAASDPSAVPAGAFTLLSYNVQYDNPDLERSLAAIVDADADVVLLQEINARWRDALERRLATTYPHRVIRLDVRQSGGFAVLSKLPIAAEQMLPPPERWFGAQRIVVTTAAGPVQLLNVHLRPPIAQGSWFKGYLTTPPIRGREIAAFWAQLPHDLPTMVAGDFNEAPGGAALAFLAAHGLARLQTAGPTTWHYETTARNRKLDVLRLDIDHLVLDGALAATDARVLEAGTSDHRPVIATIVRR